MSAVRGSALALRFLLELCALAAVAYWGSRVSSNTAANVAVAVAAPAGVAAVWGAFLAPKASRRLDPPARWVLELAVLAAAVGALGASGLTLLAVVLAAVAVIDAILLHVWKLDGDLAR